jgi:uncharacterized membrane protein
LCFLCKDIFQDISCKFLRHFLSFINTGQFYFTCRHFLTLRCVSLCIIVLFK